jgi:deoxyribodipyrimidine photo-lyase
MTGLVWFRNDLRVNYHSPLAAACERHETVRAVYVLCERQWDSHDVARLRRWYVLSSLRELGESLAAKGIALEILDGQDFTRAAEQVSDYVRMHGISAVYYNREYPINEMRRDEVVAGRLRDMRVETVCYDDGVLLPPSALRTGAGNPYTVFTPFRRKWREAMTVKAPVERITQGARAACDNAVTFDDTLINQALARCNVREDLCVLWPPGERFAREQLQRFVAEAVAGYQQHRDFPEIDGTSQLSAALSAGTIAVRECYDRVLFGDAQKPLLACQGGQEQGAERSDTGIDAWLSELCWRDFYRQIMANFPRVSMGAPFKQETSFIQWSNDDDAFSAWCAGRTGYPLVDAAMRQLRATGWMHNRLRMVVAMFLTKQLFIDWRRGERFFMQNLLDGDFAANNGGWQWSASTGTDAAPYFRFFNPVRQSQRFDPDGVFIRRWVPELSMLDKKKIHEPWKALEQAPNYCERIVMLEGTKERVTEAFRMAKEIDQMGLH